MAVRRYLEGENATDIMASYGLCRTDIYRWMRIHRKHGGKGLRAKRHPGPASKLNAKQKWHVYHWIDGRDPRAHGYESALWTRPILADLIRARFGITVGLGAVGRLLRQIGITPQKPLRRAYERNPAAISSWKAQEYPRIKSRAKRLGGRVFFLDEAGVRSDPALGRTWAPRGKTPEVPTSGRRQGTNAISAINETGGFWYKIYSSRLNAALFIHLLQAFMRNRRGPVFIVLDGHPAHRAKLVSKYVQRLRGRLELYFLPGYAPDLNPDEFVWNYMKKEGMSKKPLRRDETLVDRVGSDLELIGADRHLVQSFFRASSVLYITGIDL